MPTRGGDFTPVREKAIYDIHLYDREVPPDALEALSRAAPRHWLDAVDTELALLQGHAGLRLGGFHVDRATC